MQPSIYKIQKPGWRIKRKFLNYISNDKSSGFYIEPALSKTSAPKSIITKGSFRNGKSTQDLTNLYNKNLKDKIEKITGTGYYMNAIWYQCYGKNTGSYHDYHDHSSSNCEVSGIYYLKLKDPKLKTEFLDTPELIVEEGDIILFDAFALHRSPPNNTNHDKIILSFNLDRIK
tara:strand:- start:16 stop:534 length:519 start_codon:yes stop_codon:yes gene_type:complete